MKYIVKIEQVAHCWIEVEGKSFDDAMKKAAYELRTDGENYKFVKQEAYVKDVEIMDR